MRDDFTKEVKLILARRVGFRCSNPDCRRATSGPQVDPKKTVNIGVAAHITAAAPGGPRYDPNVTPQCRGSVLNGIWLCQNCAKLVDNDAERYTCHVLKSWREQAEGCALVELEAPQLPPTADIPDAAWDAVAKKLKAAFESFLDRALDRMSRMPPEDVAPLLPTGKPSLLNGDNRCDETRDGAKPPDKIDLLRDCLSAGIEMFLAALDSCMKELQFEVDFTRQSRAFHRKSIRRKAELLFQAFARDVRPFAKAIGARDVVDRIDVLGGELVSVSDIMGKRALSNKEAIAVGRGLVREVYDQVRTLSKELAGWDADSS